MAQKNEEAGARGNAADLQNVIRFPAKDERTANKISAALQDPPPHGPAAEYLLWLGNAAYFAKLGCDRDLGLICRRFEEGFLELKRERQRRAYLATRPPKRGSKRARHGHGR